MYHIEFMELFYIPSKELLQHYVRQADMYQTQKSCVLCRLQGIGQSYVIVILFHGNEMVVASRVAGVLTYCFLLYSACHP